MKVLLVNGSPHQEGCTYTALAEVGTSLNQSGIDTDMFWIGNKPLNDWRETSANQTIALTEYFLKHYNIDPEKAYANGYSGGGETMSLVMGKRPELFAAYLHCSSQWDGDLAVLAQSRTPVYLAVGRNDEYYGSEPTQSAYDTLYNYK